MSASRFHVPPVVREAIRLRPFVVAMIAVAIAVVPARPAVAQTLRGQVVEEGTGTVIAGALVLLVSPDGDEAASAVSGGTGAYVIRVPAPGEWSLRVERIGFASSTAGPFRLATSG